MSLTRVPTDGNGHPLTYLGSEVCTYNETVDTNATEIVAPVDTKKVLIAVGATQAYKLLGTTTSETPAWVDLVGPIEFDLARNAGDTLFSLKLAADSATFGIVIVR